MQIRSYLLLAAVALFVHLAAAQQFEAFGLSGKTVTAMTYYGGALYAATENDGVYRRTLGALDSGWVYLGIPAKNLTSIFAFHTICPLICWKGVLVGVELSPASTSAPLIYFYQQRPDTCQIKGSWIVSDSGITRIGLTRVTAIGGVDVCHPIGPTYVTAFAATSGAIWRSEDRGKDWKMVWRDSVASILAFAAGSKQSMLSTDDEMWAGGYMVNNQGTRYPLILRSTDSGLHWENRPPPMSIAEECRALALHPTDANLVYAALTHTLLKSNDAGKTWRATTFPDNAVSFRALVVNRQQPEQLFAGGMLPQTEIAKLYESKDAGESWQEVLLPNTLGSANSLVFDPANDRQVYLATSNTGVYRYPRLTVNVAEEQSMPKSFHVSANFPNPFNLHENAGLTLRLDVPATDRVTVRLFNLVGQEIGIWKFLAKAGAQNFSVPLQAANLTGGIYFMRAEWREQWVTQKLTLIR